MKRRILCPTDFSKNAQNAIEYAIELFKKETCEFYILHTYKIEAFAMELSINRDLEESRKNSIGGLKVTLEWLSVDKGPENHKFHMVSECGDLMDTMKTMIEKQDIDLVVMGTKGSTDSRLEIYGSQTVLAMEEIRNCPVLAIPSQAVFTEIKEIVFPTNYKTTYKRREFQYLVDIAKISNSSIAVVHVLHKNDNLDADQIYNQNLLKDYFEDLDFEFHTVKDKDVHKGINLFIEGRGSNMVAFFNKKHSFFGMILSRPMVKNLGYRSTIPILALHDYRR
ncbi:universal stress protein [Sediminicola sp. 1XM1-17]|uniref:universal stress protein n=1 Tax=Sediminicola sp. 1XM1-17 TaxID=3127702 RepID=UPI0030787089